jgi:hypothetical protein
VIPVAPGNRSGGGLPARRAVVRWAARTVRRGWRQQALVIAAKRKQLMTHGDPPWHEVKVSVVDLDAR